jgi:hypothetical protein
MPGGKPKALSHEEMKDEDDQLEAKERNESHC